MPQLLAALQSDLGANYTLQRELGGGGMSRVFLAEEARFRRAGCSNPTSLNVLPPNASYS